MARVFGTLSIFSLLVFRSVTAAPSCATVSSELNSCIPYIEGNLESPSSACCAGVKSIAGQIKAKSDIVGVCNCVKEVITKLGVKVIPSRVSELPRKCGIPVNLPPIDKNYDCSKLA